MHNAALFDGHMDTAPGPRKVWLVSGRLSAAPTAAQRRALFVVAAVAHAKCPHAACRSAGDNVQITNMFLDAKEVFAGSSVQAIADLTTAKILKLAEAGLVDLVYLTDDPALATVGLPLLRSGNPAMAGVAFVFAGFNGDPVQLYPDAFLPNPGALEGEAASGATTPGDEQKRRARVVGVLEREDAVAVIEVVRMLKPTTRRLILITDSSALRGPRRQVQQQRG